MTRSTATPPVRLRGLLIGLAAILALGVLGASSAQAEYTQKYLGQITLASGGDPRPVGVDPQGNIIVFLGDQEVLAKFDPSGNPVNFSALGTNVIDGAGGLECATTPADCDRVPSGQIGPVAKGRTLAVVDSSGGPTDGYIYLRNHNTETSTGEIDVFAPTGKFLGTINESQAAPWSDPTVPTNDIGIAPNGSIYVTRANLQPEIGEPGASRGGGHVDQYAPIDGNPAHDQFVGQLRLQYQWPVPQVNFPVQYVIGAGPNGAFVRSDADYPELGLGNWHWYSLEEFQKPGSEYYARAKDYMPFSHDGDNAGHEFGATNPNNNWIYLINDGGIAIYDTDAHHKIGPAIGTEPGQIGSGANTFAFDDSGGPNTGKFYVKGGPNTLSVFGAPVVIPDITVNEPEPGHTSAVLHATIGTAGGPNVTACQIEYGLTTSYGLTKPCSPAPEYSGTTQISAELTGLFTEADYHYRVTVTNANGYNHTFDNVFHTVAVLNTQTGTVSNLTSTTATLNGTLDPDGKATTHWFEYGIDKIYDLETEHEAGPVAAGPVTPADIEQLQPGRTYHYRLVAENTLGRTNGPDRTFTVPATPQLSGLNPTNVLSTSVDLNARINDFDSEAEYFFEYGESQIYAHKTSIGRVPASPGTQAVTVHVTGLEAGFSYHFRLVATNGYGTSKSGDAEFDFLPPACPNAHVRQQVGANYLPDCRAYELVSPSRAGSIQLFPGDFFFRLGGTEITSEELGNRYENTGYESSPPRFGFFGGLGGLAGVESPNFIFDHYLSTRTNDGWVTHYTGLKGDETGVSLRGQCSLTQDKCLDYKVEFSLSGLRLAPFPYVWSADGTFLNRWPTNYAVVPEADHLTGDQKPSGDFTHFVFSSLDVAFAPGGLTVAPGSVYDNTVASGSVKVVSKLENGDPIPQDAGNDQEYIKIPAVSADGSHILMSTVASGGRVHLYMSVNDVVNYDITKGNGVQLIGMSANGSKVAFVSPNALTEEDKDSSTDIYEWDEATNEVKLISKGNGNGNSDSCNANWTSGCDVQKLSTQRPDIDDAMSASGDVYFYSPEQLDSSNPGVYNQRNLYHERDGKVQYVTTLDPGTTTTRAQIGDDGQHAAFLTKSQLTGYENSYYDNFGNLRKAAEMYVFDAGSDEVQCASCDPTGAPPSVLRSDPPGNEAGTTSADALASNGGRFMSDDGRVAFATAEALVPRDTDGIIDVYEYTGGRPQLIGAGTGDRDSLPALAFLYPGQDVGLESMSRDGRDIYFSTYDTLVPQDRNGAFVKFYDARTGGGFVVSGSLLPCEAADECHGETSISPSNPQVGTGIPYTASGNLQPSTKKPKKHRHPHKRRRHKHSHSTHRNG